VNRSSSGSGYFAGVSPLREFDCGANGVGVSVRHAIRQQDEGLPSRFLPHDVLGRLLDRAIDEGGEFSGNTQAVQRRLQFAARRGQSLQQFNLSVELNNECPIFVPPQRFIQKCITGPALFSEDARLAPAGVNQKADGERKIGFFEKKSIF
jgi:hypothetical protein